MSPRGTPDPGTHSGSQAGASARSVLAHLSPGTLTTPARLQRCPQVRQHLPSHADGYHTPGPGMPCSQTLCHPGGPRAHLRTEKMDPPELYVCKVITKHVSPSSHPKTTLHLPESSRQTSWAEYLGSVFPAHGKDRMGNVSFPIQLSSRRFGCTLELLGICTHLRIQ